jgi:hypothetical protein
MRIFSVLIASAVVPLTWRIVLQVTSSTRDADAATMFVALFPGLYPDVVRVSTDALLVPVAAAIFLALLRFMDSRSRRNAVILGLLLLAGMSTKAFIFPILAAVVIAVAALGEFRTAAALTFASAASGVWYARNFWITGSYTGLPQTVSAKTSLWSSIVALGSIRWTSMIDVMAISHIWIGNFSLLQYRSWMYRLVEFLFVAGVVGFIAHMRKSSSNKIHALLLIYAVFIASLVYFATQMVQEGLPSVIQGWYLSPMLPIEALVLVLGLQNLVPHRVFPWIAAAVAFCFLALLIYGTVFIEAPYYSGFISHSPSGGLRGYAPHWPDIAVMGDRLTRFHPWIPSSTPLVLSVMALVGGLFLIRSFLAVHRR